MRKLYRNDWRREPGQPFERAEILTSDINPEGLDVDRIRFLDAGRLRPRSHPGQIMSVIRGRVRLAVPSFREPLRIESGVHVYVPPGVETELEAESRAEIVRVRSPVPSQARGRALLVRDETFLAASATSDQSLRWILTPQYLSRRIFLHHDPILLSKSGHPVSWFRTTMFDVSGLPPNEDGDSVFKMAYNSRTEFNVCYDVEGRARVRMAEHPYKDRGQSWSPWLVLDGDSTYHLSEAAGGPEEERAIVDGTVRFHRNKHEVLVTGGHVSLFCLFDPAPTGIERHRPGEYSDYEPLSEVVTRKEYETHRNEIARYDEMVDRLSLAKAEGSLDELRRTPIWSLYLEGRNAQAAIEAKLRDALAVDGRGRERVIARWLADAPAIR